MECKNTYIKRGHRSAFTLVEVMVAAALSLVVGTAIALLALYSSRSFVAMTHYMEMGQLSRLALDKMSLDIRQTRQLTKYSTNSLTFQNADGNSLEFTYDPTARTLVRVSGGKTNTYLKECDSLQFWIYQHTVKPNKFECYEQLASVANARVIQVTWKCSRTILGKKVTTDNVQSSQIALRNH